MKEEKNWRIGSSLCWACAFCSIPCSYTHVQYPIWALLLVICPCNELLTGYAISSSLRHSQPTDFSRRFESVFTCTQQYVAITISVHATAVEMFVIRSPWSHGIPYYLWRDLFVRTPDVGPQINHTVCSNSLIFGDLLQLGIQFNVKTVYSLNP